MCHVGFQLTKSGLMVFGFCPVGSTSKVDLTFGESQKAWSEAHRIDRVGNQVPSRFGSCSISAKWHVFDASVCSEKGRIPQWAWRNHDGLGAGKGQQWCILSKVCSLDSFQVGSSCVSSLRQVAGTPGKRFLTEQLFNNDVSHEPAVPPIAIWKAVNAYESVLESHSYFFRGVGFMFKPKKGIIA